MAISSAPARRVPRALAAALAAAFVLMAVCSTARAQTKSASVTTLVARDAKQVLVIHSSCQGCPSVAGLNQGLNEVLAKNATTVVRRQEFMAMGGPNATPRYEELFRQLLTVKYRGAEFQGIVSVGHPALLLAAALRAELFPETPIMAVGIDMSGPMPEDMADIYVVAHEPPHAATLALALQHTPGARRVLVIKRPPAGAPAASEALERALAALPEGIETTTLPADDPNAVEIALSDAGTRDVVYLADWSRVGPGGQDRSQGDVRRMAHVCKVPIYTSRAEFMGTGVLGGRLASWTEQGRRAAWLLTGHFNGRYLRKFDPAEGGRRTLFDHNALKRFGIRAEGADRPLVINQPETTLDTVRKILDIRYIGAVFFLLIVLMVLIHRRRTREAQKRLDRMRRG